MNTHKLACASTLALTLFACGSAGPADGDSRSAESPITRSAEGNAAGRIQAPLTGGVIAQCGTTISSNGNYTLGADLTASPGIACITFSSAVNAVLDCQDHTIHAGTSSVAIDVESSRGVAIQGCHFEGGAGYHGGALVTIYGSTNVSVARSTALSLSPVAGTALSAIFATELQIVGNAFQLPIQVQRSTSSYVANNSLYCMAAGCAALIWSEAGGGNTYTNNFIDGEAGVGAALNSPGSDDGIVIDEESGDTISANTIHNVWDTGIETANDVSYLTIENNTIVNATVAGIGGWWWSSFSNGTVTGNYVNGSASLFTFMRYNGLLPAESGNPAQTGVYFQNNTFSGNTLVNEYLSGGVSGNPSVYMPLNSSQMFSLQPSREVGTTPSPDQYHLANNTFSNNNFGTAEEAYFGSPPVPGAVIDGGGNVCRATNDATFALACGRATVTGVFWNGDFGYPGASPASVGDWSPGNYKGQCALGRAVVGVSRATNGVESHAVECGPQTIPMGTDASGSQCNVRVAHNWDNRGTNDNGTDWDPGSYKTECAANEYVAGVSQTAGGDVASLLCCPATVAHNSCGAQVFYSNDSSAFRAPDWDPGYYKGQCQGGQYVAGISSPATSSAGVGGAAHAVLCCAP